MGKTKKIEIENGQVDAAPETPAVDTPGNTDVVPSEVTAPVESEAPKTVIPEKKEKIKKESQLERWISLAYRFHSIIINVKRESGEVPLRVMFKDYVLGLDLSKPEDKLISDGLKVCGREGRDIFIVGNAYGDHEVKNQTEFLARMRRMTEEGARGIYKLRALFTIEELEKAGLNQNTMDENALVMLALRTKSIKEIV